MRGDDTEGSFDQIVEIEPIIEVSGCFKTPQQPFNQNQQTTNISKFRIDLIYCILFSKITKSWKFYSHKKRTLLSILL